MAVRVHEARDDRPVQEHFLLSLVGTYARLQDGPVVIVFHETVPDRFSRGQRIQVFRCYSLHFQQF